MFVKLVFLLKSNSVKLLFGNSKLLNSLRLDTSKFVILVFFNPKVYSSLLLDNSKSVIPEFFIAK